MYWYDCRYVRAPIKPRSYALRTIAPRLTRHLRFSSNRLGHESLFGVPNSRLKALSGKRNADANLSASASVSLEPVCNPPCITKCPHSWLRSNVQRDELWTYLFKKISVVFPLRENASIFLASTIPVIMGTPAFSNTRPTCTMGLSRPIFQCWRHSSAHCSTDAKLRAGMAGTL